MNPKLLLNFLLIPISFKIPAFSSLSKGGKGGTKLNSDEGFTIIDVIIGILIAFLFLMASLQAMVVEAYFRIQGQASSEGLLLIQQDLEEVRFKASLANLTNNTNTTINECNPQPSTAGADDAYKFGYAATLASQLGMSLQLGGPTMKSTANSDGTYNHYSYYTYSKSPVSPLKINSVSYQLTVTGNIVHKEQIKDGDSTASTTDNSPPWGYKSPYNVLELTYSVKRDPNGGTNYTKEVATLYTEVIPDAAFQCN